MKIQFSNLIAQHVGLPARRDPEAALHASGGRTTYHSLSIVGGP